VNEMRLLAVRDAVAARWRARSSWLAALATAIIVGGCASLTSAPTGSGPLASTVTPLETVFTSPLYDYSAAVTTAWRIVPAIEVWDGEERLGHDYPMVDQLIAPKETDRCEQVARCGPIAWVLSFPASESLESVAAEMDAFEDVDHGCPATPETHETTEIDGEPAQLTSTHCPEGAADGGRLILRAIALHDGTAYYFWMQDPAGEYPLEPLTRSAFETLLEGVRLPDGS
jgi:hypothetical protein